MLQLFFVCFSRGRVLLSLPVDLKLGILLPQPPEYLALRVCAVVWVLALLDFLILFKYISKTNISSLGLFLVNNLSHVKVLFTGTCL